MIEYNNAELVLNGEYKDAVINVPANTLLKFGTVLGEITASGKLTQFKSANTNGTEKPMAILAQDCDNSEVGSAVDFENVRILVVGAVRSELLIFDGTDTKDTVIASVGKVENVLKNNGILIKSSHKITE